MPRTPAGSSISSLAEAAIRLSPRGQRILVAVSGGVDSMVLLDILQRAASGRRWQLQVAHLNHCLRGRSSDADERLVRRTARTLKIPVSVERAPVRAIARRNRLSLEMAARQVRHEFLARVAEEKRISTIVLAHHADDQVELFFLRLFRGTGPEGLTGMEEVSRSPSNPRLKLVRPLLEFTKEQLLTYAREQRIEFREDRSNRSIDILRNRVRHELLPLLQRNYQAGLQATILRLMKILREESRFIASAAALARDESKADSRNLPLALRRRLLQQDLIALGLQPSFQRIEQLRRAGGVASMIEPGKFVKTSPEGRLVLYQHPELKFRHEEHLLSLGKAGRAVFEGMQLQWAITGLPKDGPQRVKYRPGTESFDAEKVGDSIVLRHWRPGDRFQPIGMPGPVKLQDLFVNRKIARADRHNLLIAATAAGEIVWVEGLRISERFKLDKGTRRRLKWIWRRV